LTLVTIENMSMTSFSCKHVASRMARVGMALAGGALSVVVVALAGCPGYGNLCDPSLYPGGDKDPDYVGYCTDVDAGADGGDGGDGGVDAPADAPIGTGACPGQCVPGPPSLWDAPALVWLGAEGDAPPCPASAPQTGFEGHADLVAPTGCGACQCEAPSGTCGLPPALTAGAATCALVTPGTPMTPFDPPTGWDGGCTTADAVVAGASCAAGPCVQSLTLAPLSLDEGPCVPTALPAHDDPTPRWAAFARTCRGFPVGACADWGAVCAPPPAAGFRVCVLQAGDVACPDPASGPYQERHVAFGGFTDTRSCSPCTCGSPAGGACAALVSYFTDGACGAPLGSATVTAAGASCADLPAGAALGSKSAGPPGYTPGACQPAGGEPLGAATPVSPVTLCCIPSP
jgi:hypothetical protein